MVRAERLGRNPGNIRAFLTSDVRGRDRLARYVGRQKSASNMT
ncbi:hypothetical protein [Mesorhizobium sp. M1060]